MDIQRISQYKKTFDDITHEVKSDNGEEQIVSVQKCRIV